MGGAANRTITPYASLLPEGDDLETYSRVLRERAIAAQQLGFRAAKLEICLKGPYVTTRCRSRTTANVRP